jgi:hypothetical protein
MNDARESRSASGRANARCSVANATANDRSRLAENLPRHAREPLMQENDLTHLIEHEIPSARAEIASGRAILREDGVAR